MKKNFGFGMMRLPMNGSEVDLEQTSQMVDYFLDHGFNYFDTAHGYINGRSETAIRECLVKRHPRESFILADKLTGSYFKKQEDIRPLFESQLEACGVDYFDFYLMHAQNSNIFEQFKKCRAYETAFELKKEGKVRHVGISFHDKAEVLERILTEYPAVEIVQIQFNYLDYESASVESRKVYEVCEKYDKPVVVMEPVKGGSLVNLPEDAQEILDELHGGSNASYAIRFAAGFPNMRVILSGMSDMDQMEDNVSFMEDYQPLNEKELEALRQVCEVYDRMHAIPCTACRYCIEESFCPKNILIPDLFSSYNAMQIFNDWNASHYYQRAVSEHGKASDCIKCGKCERVCPQHLPIRDLLVQVAQKFDK
ncbi:MAG: aldo/keto reductase [Solobacterium sp.]|nr:aldo/keto reductase [Solobacterium sp.]